MIEPGGHAYGRQAGGSRIAERRGGGKARFVLLEGVGEWKLVGDVREGEIEAGIGAVSGAVSVCR